ncbi:MAG: C1 family peptidase, partial [Anaerolineae bacterium]|nr:C1 family peptidase [Anaerolineae bacterium]
MKIDRWPIRWIVLGLVFLAFWLWPLRVMAAGPEDWKQYGLGLLPSKGDFPKLDTSGLRLTSLPSAVDLSWGLPPVGNQGSQGSCVGWALGYYYKTFQERAEHHWDVSSPEHQFSPSWIYNQRSGDCSQDAGMTFFEGLRILQTKGAATLAMFPYNPYDACTQPSETVCQLAWPYRIDSFANIFAGQGTANIETLKGLLAGGQPIALAVPVYSSFFAAASDDPPIIPQHTPNEYFYGGHAVLVIGYDDSLGAFKFVNSWGRSWGQNGYAYLSYDFVRNDAWEGWVMFDHVETQASPATFSGEVTLNGEPVPEGTQVTAWIDGVQVASTTTTMQNGRSRYTLEVPPDDPSTGEREGGRDGEVVRFKVGSEWANERGTW